MKTFSQVVVVATFAVVATPLSANAQRKQPDAAKQAPDVKADAKVDVKLKVDGKKGATPPASAKPEMPKPPPELAAMAKQMTGTWRCKGEGNEMDGSKRPLTATNRTRVDLDKWWLVDSFDGKLGTGAKATPFKFIAYTTFDAGAKKWRRYMIDNMGGHAVGTSDGIKDDKMTFHMDTWSPMGAGMFRDHADTSDLKAGVKMWGEMSMDRGKSWTKVYEMTCKK